jgi:hypothetical protein
VRRSSTVLLVGIVLLLLGAGNWVFGGIKMTEYKQRRRAAAQLGGPAVKQPFRGTESILERRTGAHDLFEDADIKYEYYRVIARGGRVVTLVGAFLAASAVARRLATAARSRA